MKIRPVGAELLHADRRTEEANDHFLWFCKRALKDKTFGLNYQSSHRLANMLIALNMANKS